MSRITPCLWYKNEAEEAALFYTSILPDSRIDAVHRSWVDTPGGKTGSVMLVEFTVGGQKMQALNGGMRVDYSQAISMSFACADQPELDRIWDALLVGGSPVQCGWLTDRYGMSWQIVPKDIGRYLSSDDPVAAARAMAAVMQMVKMDIATLEAAWRGA